MTFRRWPLVSRALVALKIDPAQFWILVDLFGMLGKRREVMNQLGRSKRSLALLIFADGLAIALLSFIMILSGPAVSLYAAVTLTVSTIILLTVLMPETNNSLVNPTESIILAHQPLNGPTYMAAKLTHILRVVLFLAPGFNLLPALLGLATKGATWSYPIFHLLLASLLAIIMAMACCSLFGWLIRFVPVPRLKSVGQMLELVPMFMIMTLQYVGPFLAHIKIPSWMPTGWQAALIGGGVGLFAIIGGLRALSIDYLLRVSSMLQGRVKKTTRSDRRSAGLGAVLASWFGGQAGRAGFDFTKRQMGRDWQAQREILTMLYSILPLLILFSRSMGKPLFIREFTPMHITPHFFGIMFFSFCGAMPYGTHHKGAWLFQLFGITAFRGFGRGIFVWLWLNLVLIPHLLLSLAWIYLWNLPHAFSVAMASFYLGLELRLISAIPFSQKPGASRSALILPIFLVGGMLASAIVAFQHFFLFRSEARAALGIVLIAGLALWVTRLSLESLAIRMMRSAEKFSVEPTQAS